jgi:Ankyrin repeats (3 copies)
MILPSIIHRPSAKQILKKVQDSIRRIRLRMDFMALLWSILFPEYSINSTNSTRRNLVESKETIPSSEKEKIVSLEEIKKNYEYVEPVTLDNLTVIENPVFDSEGFVRDKNSPHIGRSLHNRGDLVTIVESTDLKKIKNDQKTLENSYANINSMFTQMMSEMREIRKENAELRTKMDAMNDKIDSQNKEISELRKENAELKESNITLHAKIDAQAIVIKEQAIVIKEQGEVIVSLNSKIEQQDKEWELKLAKQEKNHEIKMNSVLAQMDEKDKEINSLKTIVYEQGKEIRDQRQEIIELKKMNEQKDIIIERLDNENRELNRKVEKLEALTADFDQFVPNNHHPLKRKLKAPKLSRSEESVGRKWEPVTGFGHTIAFFADRNPGAQIFRKERIENDFRKNAYEGNIVKLQARLDKTEININGRGMPDAICSIVRGFKDKTALMLSSQKGHLDCIKFLIKNGADINFLDRDNFTALDYAQQNQHKESVDFLKNQGALNGVDVIHKLKKLGIQKKDGVHYENENFQTIVNSAPAYTPTNMRHIR